MKIQTRLMSAAAPVALSVALLAQPASAQNDEPLVDSETVEEDQSVGDAGAPASGVVAGTDDNVITVTGSRIRRTEATSSAPLQIIDPVISRRSGLNQTAEIVQNSPLASGSSQVTSAISVNAQGANGGPGAQTVSLRGLGAERTLVLLNSRRAGPAGTRGEVASFDLGVLPASIIESVEILKDGASSVYGSDAIAGVVNILTKRDTDGLELTAFASLPKLDEAGAEYSISGAYGKDFGRGHFLVAGEYFHQNLLRRRDRDFLDCDIDYLFRTETGDERVDLIDPRTGVERCDGAPWGHVWAYYASNLPSQPVTLLQYDYDRGRLGGLSGLIPPLAAPVFPAPFGDLITPPGWFPVNYQTEPTNEAVLNLYHPFEAKSTAIPDTTRYTAYAEGSFDVGSGIELYTEGLFNRRETYHDYYSQFYNFGYTNQYEPGDPEDPFPGFSALGGYPGYDPTCAGLSDPALGEPGCFPGGVFLSPTGILDNYDQQINVDYYRAVVGARGDVTDKIAFDVHGQYSRSDGEYSLTQILQDVIDQQTNRAYGGGCAGQVTPISNRQCLQIAWTDPRVMYGDLTPAETAYFTETETGKTIYTQKFIEASLNGELFDLPAGAVGFAAGAVYRRDYINDRPGHITMAENPDFDPTLDPDDPDYEPEFVDNGFANNFSSGHTFGSSTTKEAFAEIEIPVFRDQPFAEDFTLSAAGRVTNVKAVRGSDGFSDTSNGNFTYKLMANWQVTPWVRVRGTYGTSYRAPALFEQFLASQVSGFRQSLVDPCVRWGIALDEGNITDRVAANCAADGIPNNHTGAGLPALVFSSGGIGVLDPERSRSWTASLILTPDFSFLPDTDIDLTIDYFDIKVTDEISQLAAYDILYNCYDSEDFPNSEFCSFFERGADGNPLNVSEIQRKFINVDEQINRGFDFTLRMSHDLGKMGRLSLLGQATLQTKDTITTLGDFDNLNGEVGDPKFTADVNLVWDYDDWSFFYGLDLIGKSSTVEEYVEDFGGLCQTTGDFIDVYGGPYCSRPYTSAKLYHSVSVTKEFQDRFEFTVGVANLLDTRPPNVSGLTELGQAPFVSQYDWLGRRLFMNMGLKF